MRLLEVFSFICLLARVQYSHEWSWSQCGGNSDNNQLLPGLKSHNVSLDVECDPSSNSTVLSWSNGNLPMECWSLLYIGYTCPTNENNESMIHCLPGDTLCGVAHPTVSSSSYTVTASLGSECAFVGCFEGFFACQNTYFTFSSQTCTWPSGLITATPSVQPTIPGGPGITTTTYSIAATGAVTATPAPHTTVQPTDTRELGAVTATPAPHTTVQPTDTRELGAVTATPAPHTTVQPTDTKELGGSRITYTYSSAIPDTISPIASQPVSSYVQQSTFNQTDFPPSASVAVWLVPVILVSCIAAVVGMVVATCYFITRKMTTKKIDMYSVFEEKPHNRFYNPVSISPIPSIESLKSYFDELYYESNESESEGNEGEHHNSEKGQTKKRDPHDEMPKGSSTDIDEDYLNVWDTKAHSTAAEDKTECSSCTESKPMSQDSGTNILEVVTDSETRLTDNHYNYSLLSELGSTRYVQDTDFIGPEQIVNENVNQEPKVCIWDAVHSDFGDCSSDTAEDGRSNKVD